MLIVTIPELCFFDERPVTETDRMLAVAFMKGGKDEEIRVRDEHAEANRQKEIKNSEEIKKVSQEGA